MVATRVVAAGLVAAAVVNGFLAAAYNWRAQRQLSQEGQRHLGIISFLPFTAVEDWYTPAGWRLQRRYRGHLIAGVLLVFIGVALVVLER